MSKVRLILEAKIESIKVEYTEIKEILEKTKRNRNVIRRTFAKIESIRFLIATAKCEIADNAASPHSANLFIALHRR